MADTAATMATSGSGYCEIDGIANSRTTKLETPQQHLKIYLHSKTSEKSNVTAVLPFH